MELAEIWRYPVKSMRGEQLRSTELTGDGVPGDRLAFVRDRAAHRVVTSRFRPALLGLQGGLDTDGEPLIDGHPWTSDEAARLVRAAAGDDADVVRFAPPDVGQRFDVLPLTVLSDGAAATLGLDRRRFRPNLFVAGVDGLDEREWVGRALRIGTAVIGVRNPRGRCVMTTFDPDSLEQDPNVLRRIVRETDGALALDCWIVRPGSIGVGDRVEVVDLAAEPPRANAGRPAV